jgi:hypothetical protein
MGMARGLQAAKIQKKDAVIPASRWRQARRMGDEE